MEKHPSSSIVIVGAGPTGLTLAAELANLGLAPVVLERLENRVTTSRALVIHARTLEVLEPLQVTQELIHKGIPLPYIHIRDRHRILATINFKDLDTRYPFALICPQNQTEAILQNKLQSFGIQIERSCEVVAITQEHNRIQVEFKKGNTLQTITTEWLIGCDGSHSLVRESASIPFLGAAYEESFILADITLNTSLSSQEGHLFFSDQGLLLLIPLPDNQFRIIASVDKPLPHPTLADFEKILQERGPQNTPSTISKLVWSSHFHIQHRLAQTLRKGNILLAGDAAHVHSPAGGQGMNTGIQDAFSLAHALYETIQSKEDTPLKSWEKQRLHVAQKVIQLTDKMTRLGTLSSPTAKFLRNQLLHCAGKIPWITRALAQRLAGD